MSSHRISHPSLFPVSFPLFDDVIRSNEAGEGGGHNHGSHREPLACRLLAMTVAPSLGREDGWTSHSRTAWVTVDACGVFEQSQHRDPGPCRILTRDSSSVWMFTKIRSWSPWPSWAGGRDESSSERVTRRSSGPNCTRMNADDPGHRVRSARLDCWRSTRNPQLLLRLPDVIDAAPAYNRAGHILVWRCPHEPSVVGWSEPTSADPT